VDPCSVALADRVGRGQVPLDLDALSPRHPHRHPNIAQCMGGRGCRRARNNPLVPVALDVGLQRLLCRVGGSRFLSIWTLSLPATLIATMGPVPPPPPPYRPHGPAPQPPHEDDATRSGPNFPVLPPYPPPRSGGSRPDELHIRPFLSAWRIVPDALAPRHPHRHHGPAPPPTPRG